MKGSLLLLAVGAEALGLTEKLHDAMVDFFPDKGRALEELRRIEPGGQSA